MISHRVGSRTPKRVHDWSSMIRFLTVLLTKSNSISRKLLKRGRSRVITAYWPSLRSVRGFWVQSRWVPSSNSSNILNSVGRSLWTRVYKWMCKTYAKRRLFMRNMRKPRTKRIQFTLLGPRMSSLASTIFSWAYRIATVKLTFELTINSLMGKMLLLSHSALRAICKDSSKSKMSKCSRTSRIWSKKWTRWTPASQLSHRLTTTALVKKMERGLMLRADREDRTKRLDCQTTTRALWAKRASMLIHQVERE